MHFNIENINENIVSLARKIGYRVISGDEKEYSMIRPIAGMDYPRFHIYAKPINGKPGFAFNLHLDQKKPSYQGARAHSGEHDGELIENEAKRIKDILLIGQ